MRARLQGIGWRLAFFLYAGFIIFLSTRSSLPAGPLSTLPGADKAAHFALYAGLCFFAFNGLTQTASFAYRVAGAFNFTVAFGAFDEALQSIVPRRVSDVRDFIADITGAFFTVVLLIIARRRT